MLPLKFIVVWCLFWHLTIDLSHLRAFNTKMLDQNPNIYITDEFFHLISYLEEDNVRSEE